MIDVLFGNQRIAGLSLIFQTFRKGYNNSLKNMFFVMIRLFDYFDICKICHYYASANQLEWRVSRNFAKCKRPFCEINFAKIGVKFRKSDRRLKFSIFGRFLEAKNSNFWLVSDGFEHETVSYFQNPFFPHGFTLTYS